MVKKERKTPLEGLKNAFFVEDYYEDEPITKNAVSSIANARESDFHARGKRQNRGDTQFMRHKFGDKGKGDFCPVVQQAP